MPLPQSQLLRLGTRGSLLARTQSQMIASAVENAHPRLRVDVVTIKTTGDRITDRPLHNEGGKGLFTKEIEQALLSGDIDFAVHSFKDVPVTMPLLDASDLVIAAVPHREDARDVLASSGGAGIAGLPPGARVGTGSLRRRCQLLALRSDLCVEMVRGNIDTRLRKMRDGEFDAIVLAAAGLNRVGLFNNALMTVIEPVDMLPAAGQGALALQCRRQDVATQAVLAVLNHVDTADCVAVERAVVAALDGDCHSPIAAFATVVGGAVGGRIRLEAAVGARDGGTPVVRASAETDRNDPAGAVSAVVASLVERGATRLLHAIN